MKKSKISTNDLVKAAFLVAISIVLTRFLSVMIPIGGALNVRIGFGRIPLMMSGILFGPVIGGITGFAADFIGMLINPVGQFHPGFALSAILDGVIPGLIFIYYKKHTLSNESYVTKFRVFVPAFILTILNSIILNTFWLYTISGKAVIAALPLRALNAFVNLPIQVFAIYSILKNIRD